MEGVTVVFSLIGGKVDDTNAGVFRSVLVLGLWVTLKVSGVDGLGRTAPVVAVDFDVGVDAGDGCVALDGVAVVFSFIGEGVDDTNAGVFRSGLVLGVCVTLWIAGVDSVRRSTSAAVVAFVFGVDTDGG